MEFFAPMRCGCVAFFKTPAHCIFRECLKSAPKTQLLIEMNGKWWVCGAFLESHVHAGSQESKDKKNPLKTAYKKWIFKRACMKGPWLTMFDVYVPIRSMQVNFFFSDINHLAIEMMINKLARCFINPGARGSSVVYMPSRAFQKMICLSAGRTLLVEACKEFKCRIETFKTKANMLSF